MKRQPLPPCKPLVNPYLSSLPPGVKPRREKKRECDPWNTDMTLCIAALCQSQTENIKGTTVVAAINTRLETNISSSNTGIKFHPVGKGWVALLAGSVSQARELVDLYDHLLTETTVSSRNVLETLKLPPRQLRSRLADSITFALVNMSHREFLDTGRTALSDEMLRHVENQISAQRIECQLILIGNVDGRLAVFVCNDGDVTEVEVSLLSEAARLLPNPSSINVSRLVTAT